MITSIKIVLASLYSRLLVRPQTMDEIMSGFKLTINALEAAEQANRNEAERCTNRANEYEDRADIAWNEADRAEALSLRLNHLILPLK